MKRTLITLAALCLGAGLANAADVAPQAVAFDEHGAVAASLTDVPGDAANGAKVFANRKQGNCLACHQNSDMKEALFHGEVGPSLDGVADRWEPADLRGIVVNSKRTFEGSIMPAFYKDTGFERPLKKFDGKSILNAQQVEDVVAYLLTLKEN
jgi:sulfur-oxidizing protein SoxX